MSSASFSPGWKEKPLLEIQDLVYAPGSSTTTSYFIVDWAGARIPLDDVQLLGVRMPGVVEPCHVVEAYGIDHQRASLPMADRMSQPIGIRVFRMWAAVHPYLAPNMRAAFKHK